MFAETYLLADHDGSDDDPCHEHYLGEVVPLHIPVILRINNELTNLLRFHISGFFILILIKLIPFIHLLNGVTSHPGHHADYFLLLANGGP